MTKHLPISDRLRDEILQFLTDDRYGNVRLNIKAGRIVNANFSFDVLESQADKDSSNDDSQNGCKAA